MFFVCCICTVLLALRVVEGSLQVSAAPKGKDLSAAPQKEVVKIVAYDPIRGYLNWMQPWFREAARTQCSTECIISEDTRHLKESDVVLFHAPTHGKSEGGGKGKPIPDRKIVASHATYAFLSMEQPKYVPVMMQMEYLKTNFDLMITYSSSTKYPESGIPNMPITYYPLNVVSPEAVLRPPKPIAEKTGYGTGVTVAAFVSNCKAAGADKRAAYLQELMKYIPVHSYGGCAKNRDEPEMPHDPEWPAIAQKRARKVNVLSNYKFYFAFENSVVDDYVSEKIFEGLFAGTVPIYKGAPRVGEFMPSTDSYIDASNLKPLELANLLKNITSDTDRYNSYFAYKSRPLSESFKQVALNSYTHPNTACRLCDYAKQVKNARINGSNPHFTDMQFKGSVVANEKLRYIRHDWSEKSSTNSEQQQQNIQSRGESKALAIQNAAVAAVRHRHGQKESHVSKNAQDSIVKPQGGNIVAPYLRAWMGV